ncbi:hypothetical protein SAY87_013796 [Trapa incisa]|uniref:BHLH domain-containing protein n=1 Tax=Trapa incisa TaxID=236973 RepID=A0AAN7QDT9_9MYRT|nr:hypothetical protein SAY87_013796 [Trapa incisa]
MDLNSLLNKNVTGDHQNPPLHEADDLDIAAGDDHDFLDQMFSTMNPSWPDLNPADGPELPGGNSAGQFVAHFDESLPVLASKLRLQQTGGGASMMLQQQQLMMMGRGLESSHGDVTGVDESVLALYNGFAGSTHGGGGGGGQPLDLSPPFHHPHPQGGTPSFGAQRQAVKTAPAASESPMAASTGQPRQRTRARRGQATDPHSIAERLRRERIAERMKALQELVPNANKTDKASMLDEIIDYVKFLQLQVKVLSLSRLGGAAAVAPLVADISSEGGDGGDYVQNGGGRSSSESAGDTLTMTEQQVAKLIEEDMGSAMQYLQGKGLCLMPISLATAISTVTCNSGRPLAGQVNALAASNGDGPTSPAASAMTVQSASEAKDASRS